MLSIRDFEEYAEKHMDRKSWAYYSQGAERESTLRENLRCFTRYMFIPRMLCNVQHRDMSVTVLGEPISMPIGAAPTAFQRLAHPDGEIAASRAASEADTIYTLSTVATSSLESVSANRKKDSPLWMQIYLLKNRKGTKELIRRVEASGYKALVLTVDAPVIGLQLRHMRNKLQLPPHMNVPNILPDFGNESTDVNGVASKEKYLSFFSDYEDVLTWNDVDWIRSVSKLPLVIKGILTVEDALEAARHGASAVWISNHGGRQLDGVLSALDVLPQISSALSGSGCEVYMDGGIRWGSDVLKALALGARMVFIGRPVLWGLNHSGQDGVRSVLEILRSELDKAMHLSGCGDISDIGPHLVRKRSFAKI